MKLPGKWFLVCYSFSFLIGFGFSFENGIPAEPSGEEQEMSVKKRVFFSRKPGLEEKKAPRQASVKYDYAGFAKRLKGKLRPEEYELLFEEILAINEVNPFNARMNLLLKHWGEVSPRQALEKVLEHKGGQYWVYLIFDSWARRNPEQAAAYYEESEDRKIRGNYYALSVIASQWALHNPDEAWEWLHEQKGKGVFTEEYELSRQHLIRTIAESHSDRIPDLIDKLDAQSQEDNAYVLAQNWPEGVSGYEEWLNTLSVEGSSKAEAGRIMSMSEGNFDKIREEVSRLDAGTQGKVIHELMSPLMKYGGNDITERVEWLLDTLPPENNSLRLQLYIGMWFDESGAEGREWVESLPEAKKERIIGIINSRKWQQKY